MTNKGRKEKKKKRWIFLCMAIPTCAWKVFLSSRFYLPGWRLKYLSAKQKSTRPWSHSPTLQRAWVSSSVQPVYHYKYYKRTYEYSDFLYSTSFQTNGLKSAAESWVSKPSLCNLLTVQTKTEAFTLTDKSRKSLSSFVRYTYKMSSL